MSHTVSRLANTMLGSTFYVGLAGILMPITKVVPSVRQLPTSSMAIVKTPQPLTFAEI